MRSQAVRFLRSGSCIVGAVYLSPHYAEEAVFLNFAIQQACAFRQPRPKSVLQLGLGAGTATTYIRQQGQ